MNVLKLKSDTAKRKRFFTAESFAHPAKLHLGLLEWIVFTYTSEGETILDPMLGSGTLLYATLMGRSVVGVELESKFVSMAEDNLKKLNQMPLYLGVRQRGQAQIIQGDARQLENVLCDKIVTSPPYVTGARGNSRSPFWDRLADDPTSARYGREKHPSLGEEYSDSKDNIGNLPYGEIDKCIFSPPYAEQMQDTKWMQENQPREHRGTHDPRSQSEDNISNLPYGQIDSAIFSPPYGITDESQSHMTNPLRVNPNHPDYRPSWKRKFAEGYGESRRAYNPDNPSNIGNLPYGQINHIISSPPYEGSLQSGQDGIDDSKWTNKSQRSKAQARSIAEGYSAQEGNIGNLKSSSYLEAMLQVYQSCYSVLKPNGLMILVVKPFIRDQKLVPLQEDTKRLCEQSGFSFLEEHHRILTSQSFWRVIYSQRYPDAPKIDREYVLIFQRDKLEV